MSSEVVARGGTLREAFVEALLGLFALAVDPAAVQPREVREVRAHGASPEALLAQWIEECRYVFEMEGFVCHAIDLAMFDVEPRTGGEPLRLYAFLHGEEIDPTRHRRGAPLKPVSSGDITILSMGEGYEIRMTLAS